MCVCVCVCARACVCVCVRACVWSFWGTRTRARAHTHTYAHTHTHTHTYTHTHTHTRARAIASFPRAVSRHFVLFACWWTGTYLVCLHKLVPCAVHVAAAAGGAEGAARPQSGHEDARLRNLCEAAAGQRGSGAAQAQGAVNKRRLPLHRCGALVKQETVQCDRPLPAHQPLPAQTARHANPAGKRKRRGWHARDSVPDAHPAPTLQ